MRKEIGKRKLKRQMKHTIKDLSEGRVQAYFSEECELEDLIKLVELAFPECIYQINGGSNYYTQWERRPYNWTGCFEPNSNLPIQKVSDFDLEEEWIPKQGELVDTWSEGFKPKPRIYLGKKIIRNEEMHMAVFTGQEAIFHQGGTFEVGFFQNISQIKEKKTITMQQIADNFGYEVDEIEIENLKQ